MIRVAGVLAALCERLAAATPTPALDAEVLVAHVLGASRAALAAEPERTLALAMHFPVGWDPFFSETMSLLDVYHYGTQHFDFHRRQLALRHDTG